MHGAWIIGAVVAALGVAAGCGTDGFGEDSDNSGNSDGQGSQDPGGGFGPGAGGSSAGGPFGTGGAALPPEVEVSVEFELPKAGERFVYAANPASDSVAVIDANTLAIETVEAGDEPTFLQTLGQTDNAIVLNVGSSDATIIRTGETGSVTNSVDVVPGANAIAVAPDAAHAVVYYDAAFANGGQAPGSFQDVTVITLDAEGDSSTNMTVGFRPIRVFFSSDGARGFIVTEDGISVLDFASIEASGPDIARTVPLGETGIDLTLDVSVTPDGVYALAREQEASVLRLVELDSGAIEMLDLAAMLPPAGDPVDQDAGPPPPSSDGGIDDDGGLANDSGPPPPPTSPGPPGTSAAITDVDLAPSGTFALAVARDRSALIRLPIPEAFTDPSQASVRTIEGELIGSVEISLDERYAVLYTTAVDQVERITIVDLQEHTAPRRVQLRKTVRAIAISPDSEAAVVIHKKLEGDPNDPFADTDTKVDRSFGFSLVNLSTGFAKLELTAADLGPFTTVPDHLFVLLNDPGTRLVHEVQLESFQSKTIQLGSPPVSIGAVPGSSKIFVGQEHTGGRITFIDWTNGSVRSVTGFELNSRIRE